MITLQELNELIESGVFKNTTSSWLKDALDWSKDMDVVDMLKDVEFLHVYLTEKFLSLLDNDTKLNFPHSPFNK